MKTFVQITLTELEADMLSSVAGNGWGDGDFAGWLGNPEHAKACLRAMEKLQDAIAKRAWKGQSHHPHAKGMKT